MTVTETQLLDVIVGPRAIHMMGVNASACGLAGRGWHGHPVETLTLDEVAQRRRCRQPGCLDAWPDSVKPDDEPHFQIQSMPGTFSTGQLADLTGSTYRQIDYWVRTGVLRQPTAANRTIDHGSGTRRRWTADDVALVSLICKLRDLGAADGHIRHIVAEVGAVAAWPSSARTFWLADAVGFVIDLDKLRREARQAVAS